MYTKTFALTLASLAYLARADLSLDRDDVPQACLAICEPLVQLTSRCDVDLRSDNDRDEDMLERQCVCTNNSFAVAAIAGLCADCLSLSRSERRPGDDDDDLDDAIKDMNDILFTCGFQSTTYASSDATRAQTITVSAVAPTDISQLTTTIIPGRTDAGNDSGSRTTGVARTVTAAPETLTITNDRGDTVTSVRPAPDVATTNTDNAAPTAQPLGLAGALVAGAMLMMA